MKSVHGLRIHAVLPVGELDDDAFRVGALVHLEIDGHLRRPAVVILQNSVVVPFGDSSDVCNRNRISTEQRREGIVLDVLDRERRFARCIGEDAHLGGGLRPLGERERTTSVSGSVVCGYGANKCLCGV